MSPSAQAGAPPAPLPIRPHFFAYAVVDTSTSPATPIEVKMTRAEARDFITWRDDGDTLRIRRARVTLYQS